MKNLTLTIFLVLSLTVLSSAQINEFKLLASDSASEDEFGRSVSISGDYAIIGAAYNDDFGSNSGSAYIFKRNGINWTEQEKLTASDDCEGKNFGRSVSISGDYAIVGAPGYDCNGSFPGSAYIFLGKMTPVGLRKQNLQQVMVLTAICLDTLFQYRGIMLL